MTISIFLIAYLIFLIVYAVFVIANLYHIFKYGIKNFTTFFVTFLFLAGIIFILLVSITQISQLDWGLPIEFNNTYV